MDKILITGYKGFIGKNMYQQYEGKFFPIVIGLDSDYLLNDNWDNILINFLNENNPDVIFHMGACSNTMEYDVNYMMVRNYESTKIITDWAVAHNAKLIYSSSAASYGINNRYPSNLYGWSKYVAEQYVIGNGGVALRYFNVYGPGEEHKKTMASVAYQMYLKNIDGEKIKLFPNKPKRDFVYIDDVISANLFAVEHYNELRGDYYDVGSGVARPFEDVLNILDIKFTHAHENVIPEGYQFYTCSDVTKFMPFWRPKYTLEDGLKKYKEYLDERFSNR